MKNSKLILGIFIVSCVILSSCLSNNIPYPRIQPNFTSFTADGLKQVAAIDTVNRTISLRLEENTDIQNVNITGYTISPAEAYVLGNDIKGYTDLSEPQSVTLRLYQDYVWTISATQEIERYFTIANQIGSSIIDAPARRIVAYVPSGTELSSILVNSIKIGGSEAIMVPNINNEVIDFSSPVEISVTQHNRTEIWTIFIETTESAVTVNRVDAWTQVAWLYGAAEVGKDNGFEYRKSDSSEWTKLPTDWVTHEGGSFTGRLIHLEPNTNYFARAYSDNDYSAEVPFTTGSIAELPNASFDNWHQSGKVWNPWPTDGTSFWDTGNKGATTLGQSNSVPSDDIPEGLTGKSAKLETKFVGIASVGKLAAGNMFSGVYYKTDGTNGILKFGREFDQRPTKLTGYFKYHCEPISHSSSEMTHLKNRPDTMSIYIALTDWTEPYEIRTNPNNRQLFDSNAPEVIAYGQMLLGQSVDDYTKFEITLDYRDTQRKPRYIVVVASASKYGDFFTGGDGSVLYIDDFNLEYDY